MTDLTKLLDEVCAAISAPLTCPAPHEQFQALRQAIGKLEAERDELRERLTIPNQLPIMPDLEEIEKLKAKADLLGELLEAVKPVYKEFDEDYECPVCDLVYEEEGYCTNPECPAVIARALMEAQNETQESN